MSAQIYFTNYAKEFFCYESYEKWSRSLISPGIFGFLQESVHQVTFKFRNATTSKEFSGDLNPSPPHWIVPIGNPAPFLITCMCESGSVCVRNTFIALSTAFGNIIYYATESNGNWKSNIRFLLSLMYLDMLMYPHRGRWSLEKKRKSDWRQGR